MAFLEVSKVAKAGNYGANLIHSARSEGTVPRWMEKRGNKWFVDQDDPSFKVHLKLKLKRSRAQKEGLRRRDKKVNEEAELLARKQMEREEELLNSTRRVKRKKKSKPVEPPVEKVKPKKKVSQSKKIIKTSPKEKRLTITETERLQELSIQADLSQPIVKLRLQQYKIESEKLQLEQNAGNLISRELSEYLYTGYLDRLNREMLQYSNKIESNIELLVVEILMKAKTGTEIDPKIEAQKVTKMIKDETEDIIRGVKKTQKTELEKWAKDEGITL